MVQADAASGTFECFFAAARDDVYRSLLVITRDPALADDGVAEAFTRAFEHWSDVAEHPAPKGSPTIAIVVGSLSSNTSTLALPDHNSCVRAADESSSEA